MSDYVTEALGRALLDLMQEKSIEKITADELTTRAKLGRATYFRNFNAKEEIITALDAILTKLDSLSPREEEPGMGRLYRLTD